MGIVLFIWNVKPIFNIISVSLSSRLLLVSNLSKIRLPRLESHARDFSGGDTSKLENIRPSLMNSELFLYWFFRYGKLWGFEVNVPVPKYCCGIWQYHDHNKVDNESASNDPWSFCFLNDKLILISKQSFSCMLIWLRICKWLERAAPPH